MTGALDGIRVLDLTRLLPGPFCTMLLADLGADVIKVEEPGGGDPARGYGPLFAAVNRNKRSITLDLKTEADRDRFLALVAGADAVVESFRPGVMDRLRLPYSVLSEHNPRLVYASLSGFGQTGPYRDRPGHDLNYVALAGMLHYNVDADGRPVLPAVQVADLGGGSLAAVGILAALLSARMTGVGQTVDVSLYASAVAWLPTLLRGGGPGQPMLAGGLPQYGIYATSDGRFVTLGALEPRFLVNFLETIGRSDLVRCDPGTLRTELSWIFASRTRDEWVALLDGVDTCFAPVNTLEEAMADPQAIALGAFANGMLASPFAMSGTPANYRRPAPRLGEHNAEVLGELEARLG